MQRKPSLQRKHVEGFVYIQYFNVYCKSLVIIHLIHFAQLNVEQYY